MTLKDGMTEAGLKAAQTAKKQAQYLQKHPDWEEKRYKETDTAAINLSRQLKNRKTRAAALEEIRFSQDMYAKTGQRFDGMSGNVLTRLQALAPEEGIELRTSPRQRLKEFLAKIFK
jgi:hypothetical protein